MKTRPRNPGLFNIDVKEQVNMNEEHNPTTVKGFHKHHHRGASDAVYGLGMIGAAIYFIGQASSFWPGVLGFLKAVVWPVFLVLEALKSLGV